MSNTIEFADCQRALEACGVPPAKALVLYLQKLLEWNSKINLTGAKTADEFALKHVADVWGAFNTIGRTTKHIADVGSGGGIPGLILAIIAPGTEVTLVERRQKKAAVLTEIILELGLTRQVRVLPKSFEEIRTFSEDTEYWFRGFLPGPKLAVYLSEFFPRAEIGQLVLMKGPAWPQEKLDIMGQKNVKEEWQERFAGAAELHYSLPRGAGERTLVLV